MASTPGLRPQPAGRRPGCSACGSPSPPTGAVAAAVGYQVLGSASPDVLAAVQAFAAGTILTMLASVMMPTAYADGTRARRAWSFVLGFALLGVRHHPRLTSTEAGLAPIGTHRPGWRDDERRSGRRAGRAGAGGGARRRVRLGRASGPGPTSTRRARRPVGPATVDVATVGRAARRRLRGDGYRVERRRHGDRPGDRPRPRASPPAAATRASGGCTTTAATRPGSSPSRAPRELLATVDVDGATAIDWEDIAVGPPRRPSRRRRDGLPGRHRRQRRSPGRASRSTALAEPTDRRRRRRTPRGHVTADALTFTYPDGPHDAETLIVDPDTGDLFIVTKDWTAHRPLPGLPGAGRAGRRIDHRARAGGHARPAGRHPRHRRRRQPRRHASSPCAPTPPSPSTPGPRASRCGPRSAPAPCTGPPPIEKQGEAIGFAADGAAYATISEGEHPTLHLTHP